MAERPSPDRGRPATVTVDGKPAKVTSTAGGPPFKFEAPVDLAVGANTVVVEAQDGNDNIATETYSVTTTGASKNYEHDANGNLRFEKQPNGTVIRGNTSPVPHETPGRSEINGARAGAPTPIRGAER